MTRLHRGVTASVLAALVLAPWSAARAQQVAHPQIGLSAGLNMPLNDLSRNVQTGYGMNGFVAGTPTGWPVGLRGSLSYSSFSGQAGQVTQDFTAVSMEATYPALRTHDTPYFVGGAGLDHTSSYFRYPSENDLGLDFGGGYRWNRRDVSYFVEMRYVYVDHTGPSRQMLPITFGVAF